MKFRISDFKFQVSLRARLALGPGAVPPPFPLAASVGRFCLLPRLIDPLGASYANSPRSRNP